VAGNDDRDRVAGVGRTNGASRARPPDPYGKLAVVDRGAVGDRGQGGPHTPLELGTGRRQGQSEVGALAGEVLVELGARGRERPRFAPPGRVDGNGVWPLLEVEAPQRLAVADEQQFAERARVEVVTEWALGWLGDHRSLPRVDDGETRPGPRA
jgi:hypothetical protein